MGFKVVGLANAPASAVMPGRIVSRRRKTSSFDSALPAVKIGAESSRPKL